MLSHLAGAPQVQVLTVSEQYDDYASDLVQRLRAKYVRAELAPSDDTLPKKIRQGTVQKIPNLVVVGEREVEEGTVTLRRYGHRDQHTMSVDQFVDACKRTIDERLLEFALPE